MIEIVDTARPRITNLFLNMGTSTRTNSKNPNKKMTGVPGVWSFYEVIGVIGMCLRELSVCLEHTRQWN